MLRFNLLILKIFYKFWNLFEVQPLFFHDRVVGPG